ncbi:hypothetical protein GCM10020000_45680 [Streptomyces olivoverticillatus]
MGDEGGDIRGKEVLAVADAHHQGRIAPGAHDHVRLVGVHGDEREGALQAAADLPHGLGQVAAGGEGLGQQVGDDLGVGLGAEGVAAIGQLGAQLGEVLDDAVVDDGHPARVVQVRVGVGIRGAAVGGPAGVPQAGRPGGQGPPASSFSRLASLPAFLAEARPPSARTATPAES